MDKRLEMPYNLDPLSMDLYIAWKEYVREVYFMAPREIFPTARQLIKYPSMEDYSKQIERVCKLGKKHDIETMMLLNGVKYCDNEEVDRIIDYITECENWGLTGVVVANPILGQVIHLRKPNVKIRYSLLSLADNINKIHQIHNFGYVKEICLPQMVNRDEDKIKEITQCFDDMKFSMLVNTSCKSDCPLFFWHQDFNNSQSYTEVVKMETYNNYIEFKKGKEFLINMIPQNNLANPWILPSQLSYYAQYFDYFKLEDRVMDTKTLEQYLIHYALGIDPIRLDQIVNNVCSKTRNSDIDISKLPENIGLKWRNCKTRCWDCHLCDDLLPKITVKEDFKYE